MGQIFKKCRPSLLIFVLFPLICQAYLDPGLWSSIFQLLIACLAGVALASRTCWGKVKWVVLKIFPGKKAKPEEKKLEEEENKIEQV